MDRKQCFKSFWLTSVSCLSLGVVSVVSLRLLAEVYRRRIDDVSRPLLGVMFLLSFLSTGAFGMSLHSIFFGGPASRAVFGLSLIAFEALLLWLIVHVILLQSRLMTVMAPIWTNELTRDLSHYIETVFQCSTFDGALAEPRSCRDARLNFLDSWGVALGLLLSLFFVINALAVVTVLEDLLQPQSSANTSPLLSLPAMESAVRRRHSTLV